MLCFTISQYLFLWLEYILMNSDIVIKMCISLARKIIRYFLRQYSTLEVINCRSVMFPTIFTQSKNSWEQTRLQFVTLHSNRSTLIDLLSPIQKKRERIRLIDNRMTIKIKHGYNLQYTNLLTLNYFSMHRWFLRTHYMMKK